MQDQQTKTPVNGVPVDQLVETMEAVRKEPKIAKFTFRAENRWQGGGHNRAEVNGYHGACAEHARNEPFRMDMDEPPILLSGDKGANPVEYVLAALSGCLTTSLIYHAAARGIEISDVESTYEGDLDLHGLLDMDEAIRNGFEQIRVTFKVKGNASAEELDELVQIAQQRSPVYDIVTNGVPVKVERAE
ncbi:MAG: OsmC family protein [Planctomycetota bacterium]|jgi:uncharacterized OsmC-like protein